MNKIVIGTKVRVATGRNAGQVGTVTANKDGIVYVDFGRMINVNEGFGSMEMYPDGYWVADKYISVVS